MEAIKQTHAIDLAGNKVSLDYDYIKYVATIKSPIPIVIEKKNEEVVIMDVSGMGHLNPKQHLINRATWAQ